MPENPLENIYSYTKNFALATGLDCSVYDYSARAFTNGSPPEFCVTCPLSADKGCSYHTAHRYGCFEAERWQGLYIYYCPLGLTFCASIIYDNEQPAYGLISGPILMDSPEECLPAEIIPKMPFIPPERPPASVTGISFTQRALCVFLSGRCANDSEPYSKAQSNMLNSLYDISAELYNYDKTPCPIEIEQRLQKMIVLGDKHGAQELINQLLGNVYFNSGGYFNVIRDRARELVVLFSRASMEGGADVRQIFGQFKNTLGDIELCNSLEELSVLLTRIFNRFVAYVFDFGAFENSNVIHKTVGYVRENYSGKITLEDLAEYVGLSRSYLSTLIKEELGVSFTDYVNSVRIEKCKELLLNPALSLAEIADFAGYSDQSYFTKVFTRSTGATPGQFRKKRGQI